MNKLVLNVSVRTKKGNQTSTRGINKTVDEMEKILGYFEKKKWKAIKCKCYPDGTGVVFEK